MSFIKVQYFYESSSFNITVFTLSFLIEVFADCTKKNKHNYSHEKKQTKKLHTI